MHGPVTVLFLWLGDFSLPQAEFRTTSLCRGCSVPSTTAWHVEVIRLNNVRKDVKKTSMPKKQDVQAEAEQECDRTKSVYTSTSITSLFSLEALKKQAQKERMAERQRAQRTRKSDVKSKKERNTRRAT